MPSFCPRWRMLLFCTDERFHVKLFIYIFLWLPQFTECLCMCVWEMPTVVRSVVGWRCYPLGYLLSNECCCRDAYVFYVNITFIHSMRIRIRTHTCRDSRWSDDDRRMYPSMNEEARRKLFIFGLLLFSFHYTTTSKFLYLWPTRERERESGRGWVRELSEVLKVLSEIDMRAQATKAERSCHLYI